MRNISRRKQYAEFTSVGAPKTVIDFVPNSDSNTSLSE